MEKKKYNFNEIEKKWQKIWLEKADVWQAKDFDSKEKFYTLFEFPYPSGEGLHMGHLRGQTAVDVIGRKKRLEGYNVMTPIGWDAFGLPTENFAIKHKIHPAVATKNNIEKIRAQEKMLGYLLDWDREINTTDPKYYKWTQWLFLQFYKHGLAYKKLMPINWCPSCKIGLANEEVIDGKCERCGTPVERREINQWMLKITAYADRLIEGLKDLDFPEKVKTQQINWIGRSEGVAFKEKVKDLNIEFEVYDSIPQTFIAQTFAVIAPEHPLVEKLIEGTDYEKPVLEFVERIKKQKAQNKFNIETDLEGIFTGRYIDNPFGTGDLPIWVASYVIADYGTGIVNCSAHDERDFKFAKKYDIPLKIAMLPKDKELAKKVENFEVYYGRDPQGIIQSPQEFKGMTWQNSREKIIEYIEKKDFGYRTVNYKLRDWIFSRQHYWGEPIPIVYCSSCAVKEALEKKKSKLTINFYNQNIWNNIISGAKTIESRALNPEESERYFGNVVTGDILIACNKTTGEEIALKIKNVYKYNSLEELYNDREILSKISTKVFSNLKELEESYENLAQGYAKKNQKNGLVAWEFEILRKAVPVPEDDLPVELPEIEHYEPTDTGESPLSKITDWVNTKCPKCGGPAKRETDTMPNWAGSSWYYLAYALNQKFKIQNQNKGNLFIDNKKELAYWMPVDLYEGGMEHTTLHLLYSRFWNEFLYDIGLVPTSEPYKKRVPHGIILAADGRKMSKSFGNVVSPNEIVERYGADTARTYSMFIGPFDQSISWDMKGLAGVWRFLNKVWDNILKPDSKGNGEAISKLNILIGGVTDDINTNHFNTAVAKLMEFNNELAKLEEIPVEVKEKFLLLLSPFAPHIAEELWQKTGNDKTIIESGVWPQVDKTKILISKVVIPIQINGKIRAEIMLDPDASEEESKASLELENVKKYIDGKEIKKYIYVKGKIISIVI